MNPTSSRPAVDKVTSFDVGKSATHWTVRCACLASISVTSVTEATGWMAAHARDHAIAGRMP